MMVERVGARLVSSSEPVVDVTPMIGRNRFGIDADALDGVDRLQHALDPGPALDLQQDFAARTNERQRLVRLAARNRAHDVDARDDRSEVIRGPAHEGEDRAGAKRQDTPTAIENLFVGVRAEADPVLDLLLNPGQFDMGEIVLVACGRRRAAGTG